VDAVLGFATTRTTVGFVLIEGLPADGATVDSGTFRVPTAGGVAAFCSGDQVAAYKQMAARVWLRMRTIAATHRVRCVGVTWSDDADQEAVLLRKSLADAGLGNVVAVGLSDVGDALATASGYEKTAVCVIEPEVAIAFAADAHGADAHGAPKIVKHVRGSADGLVRWLTEILDHDDWRAESLVVAGSDSDREAITSQLKRTLPVPVFGAEQTQSALALGAAHACADDTEFTDSETSQDSGERRLSNPLRWSLSHPRAVLLAGALALVVLVSLGLGPPLVSNKPTGPAGDPQVPNTLGGSPAVQTVAPSVAPVAPPVQQVQDPGADTPLAPAPRVTPPVAVDIAPTRGVPEQPASLPTAAPQGPVPQQPAAPPPPQVNQVPPAVPEAPPDGQPPPRSNCFLLCGIAI
jgi:hypothetical protein